MNLPDFLTPTEKGGIRITGHRIDLYHIVKLCEAGHSAEAVHHEYPTLPPTLIDAVMRFHRENRVAVDAYVEEVDAKVARQRAEYQPGPGIHRIRGLEEARSTSSN